MKAYRLFTTDEARDLVAALKPEAWSAGETSKAVAVTKRNEEQRDAEQIDKIVARVKDSPIPKAHFVEEISAPKFNRYRANGSYEIHTDAALIRGVRTDLACTLVLTDDYEGGELCIDGREIRLPAGEVLVYDCWRPHQVKPVTKGERIACIWWMRSYIRNEDQRDLLNMLHGVIADETDETKFARLGAVHEKLVKMWWA